MFFFFFSNSCFYSAHWKIKSNILTQWPLILLCSHWMPQPLELGLTPISIWYWSAPPPRVLHSRLIYFFRNMNMFSIFYFSKLTSINYMGDTSIEDDAVYKIPKLKTNWQNQLKISVPLFIVGFFIPVSSLKVFGRSIHSERRRIYLGKSIQALQNDTIIISWISSFRVIRSTLPWHSLKSFMFVFINS